MFLLAESSKYSVEITKLWTAAFTLMAFIPAIVICFAIYVNAKRRPQ